MNDLIFSQRGSTIEDFCEAQRTLHESTILELNEEMGESDLGLYAMIVRVDHTCC